MEEAVSRRAWTDVCVGKSNSPSPGVAGPVQAPQHHGLGKAACSRRVPAGRQWGPRGSFSQLHQRIREALAWNPGEGDGGARCRHLETGSDITRLRPGRPSQPLWSPSTFLPEQLSIWASCTMETGEERRR